MAHTYVEENKASSKWDLGPTGSEEERKGRWAGLGCGSAELGLIEDGPYPDMIAAEGLLLKLGKILLNSVELEQIQIKLKTFKHRD